MARVNATLAAGLLLAISAAAQAGLYSLGPNPGSSMHRVVVRLPGQATFAYGAGPTVQGGTRMATPEDLARRASHTSFDPNDRRTLNWFDEKAGGWRGAAAAPECADGLRFGHVATILPGQRVLFSGGMCDPQTRPPGYAEHEYLKLSVWNHATRNWEPGPAMSASRVFHTATALPDGSALLVGGVRDTAAVKPVEVLATATLFKDGAVAEVGPMLQPRYQHAAAQAQGKVVVTGGRGRGGEALATVEAWSQQGGWESRPSLLVARYGHAVVALGDGTLMVFGGTDAKGMPLALAEILRPGAQAWEAAGTLDAPLAGVSAAVLQDGDVVAAGKPETEGTQHRLAHWDHTTRRWDPTLNLPAGGRVSVLPNELGGAEVHTSDWQLYWRKPVNEVRWSAQPALGLLGHGQVVVVGRRQGGPLSAELFDPAAGTWTPAGALANQPRGEGGVGAVIQLGSGRVLHVGLGEGGAAYCDIARGGEWRWKDCGKVGLPEATRDIELAALLDGRIALLHANGAHIFDGTRDAWTSANMEWQPELLRKQAPVDAMAGTERAALSDQQGRRFDVTQAAARLFSRDPAIYEPAYDTVRLADGCLLSIRHSGGSHDYAVHNPATQKQMAERNPSVDTVFGVRKNRMLQLKDGRMLVAGADSQAGYFVRAATCAGWEALPGDMLFRPNQFLDQEKAAAPAPKAALPAAPAPKAAEEGFDWRMFPFEWIVLLVFAVIVAKTASSMLKARKKPAAPPVVEDAPPAPVRIAIPPRNPDRMYSRIFDLAADAAEVAARIHPARRQILDAEGVQSLQVSRRDGSTVALPYAAAVDKFETETVLPGFDAVAEPVLRRMKDGSHRLVFCTMPPLRHRLGGAFDVDLFGIALCKLDRERIHWDDRDVFVIDRIDDAGLRQVIDFVANYGVGVAVPVAAPMARPAPTPAAPVIEREAKASWKAPRLLKIVLATLGGIAAFLFILPFLMRLGSPSVPPLSKDPQFLPCEYVGEWKQTQIDGVVRKMTLFEDGRYTLEPNRSADGMRSAWRGSWMVNAGRMTWRQEGAREMDRDDVNMVTDVGDNSFELAERYGQSHFERTAPAPAGRCGK